MRVARQRGFTLIEVVVAFAIFALSMGALYETFGGAVRRGIQARDREQSLLAAQSVLARLRVSPPPWKPEDAGRLEGGWLWRTEIVPFDAGANERTPWRALVVTVGLRREDSDTGEVVLKSIELARVTP